MQFNPSSGIGICQMVDSLVNTNNVTFPLTEKAAYASQALDEIGALIMDSSGRWTFDDTNKTTLPFAYTQLNQNQKDYDLDIEFLTIQRADILDPDDQWRELLPFSQFDIHNIGYNSFMSTPGTPQYYDKIATSIILKPPANYTKANGLRLQVRRDLDMFAATDTTKEPGIPRKFHPLIPYKVALVYAIGKDLDKKVALLEKKIQKLEYDIQAHYGTRDEDDPSKMRINVQEAYEVY